MAENNSNTTLTKSEKDYYARQLTLAEIGIQGQERLKAARVLLVGMGGLGSPLAMYLAGAGVGHLGIVEYDNVDVTNLHRQVLYGYPDVGKSKLHSAEARLKAQNPHIKITKHAEPFAENNALALVRQYDVIADGCDNFVTRYLVNDACVIAGKAFVSASVFRFEGQLSVFNYAKGPCYRCLFPAPPPEGSVPSCAEGGVLGVLPGILGTLQALEVIKLIVQKGELLSGRLLLFDALACGFSSLAFQKDANCAVCGTNASVKEVKAIAYHCNIPSADIQELTPAQLRPMLSKAGDVVLIDVRENHERDAVAILPSLHIPLAEILRENTKLPEGNLLVFYCKSGARSRRAAEFAVSKGFAKVMSLKGGIEAWQATSSNFPSS